MLILVLVMLTIAALLTVGLVRRSLDQSVAAAKKADELQRRWGVTVYFFSDREQFHRKNAKKQFAILPIFNNLPVRSQNGKGNM